MYGTINEDLKHVEVENNHVGQSSHDTTHAAPVHPRRRLYVLLATIVLALGAISAGIFWKRTLASQTDAKAVTETKAAVQPDVAVADENERQQLTVEAVTERTIETERETTGKVAFNEDRMSPVFTPYAGRIVELLVNKGEVVKSGQPLLVIESPDLVAAENDLSAARSEVDKARIAVAASEKITERARRLLEREALAAKDVQQAEADLARTREELRRNEAAVTMVENRLALFGKDAREIEQLKTPGGTIDRRVVIRAPIAGTIVERKVGPGQFLKPDAPDPLFLISDLSNVWVMADVYESNLAGIRVGAPVQISVPAFPDRNFPARISFINPTLDAASRTVRVRCTVANPGGLLKPEMFARIKIGAAAPQLVPVVPSVAVITQGEKSIVLVEESPHHFRRRQVEIGQEAKGVVTIKSGLKVGERVVTRGALLLN